MAYVEWLVVSGKSHGDIRCAYVGVNLCIGVNIWWELTYAWELSVSVRLSIR